MFQSAAVQSEVVASQGAAVQKQAADSHGAASQSKAVASQGAAVLSQAVEPAPVPRSKIPSPGPGRRPQPPRDAQPSRIPKPLAHGPRFVGWLKPEPAAESAAAVSVTESAESALNQPKPAAESALNQPKPAAESAAAASMKSAEPRWPSDEHRKGRDQPKPAAESAAAASMKSAEPHGPIDEHRGPVAQDGLASAKGAGGDKTVSASAAESARGSTAAESAKEFAAQEVSAGLQKHSPFQNLLCTMRAQQRNTPHSLEKWSLWWLHMGKLLQRLQMARRLLQLRCPA